MMMIVTLRMEKSRDSIILNVLYVSQPRQPRQMVSLKMPEPHIIVLGINNVHEAMYLVYCGYLSAKVRNKAHTPVKLIEPKITAMGRNVVNVNSPRKDTMRITMYSGAVSYQYISEMYWE